MLPLFGVYTAEYLINQGLVRQITWSILLYTTPQYEQLYYQNTHIGGLCLNQHAQYRW